MPQHSTPPLPPVASTPTVPPPAVAVAPAPTTIQEARNGGAVAGTMLVAPLAPAAGPITVGVAEPIAATNDNAAKEPLVVVTVKAFWSSPTVKATRNVIVIALGAGLGVIALQITGAGDVFGLDWSKTIHLAINAACISLAVAFSGWFMKTRDNNPVSK